MTFCFDYLEKEFIFSWRGNIAIWNFLPQIANISFSFGHIVICLGWIQNSSSLGQQTHVAIFLFQLDTEFLFSRIVNIAIFLFWIIQTISSLRQQTYRIFFLLDNKHSYLSLSPKDAITSSDMNKSSSQEEIQKYGILAIVHSY